MAISAISMHSIALAASTAYGRWHLGIGDPTVIAWIIVAAYFFSVYLAHATNRAYQDRASDFSQSDPREAENQRLLAKLWLVVAMSMLLLGINKQLDLHALFGELVRGLIQQEGWYKDRHRYQVIFTWAIVFLGALTVSLTLYWLRSVMCRALGPILGLTLIGSFVILRAGSFNHVDLLWNVNSVLNSALEFAGIGVVGVSAMLARRADPPS